MHFIVSETQGVKPVTMVLFPVQMLRANCIDRRISSAGMHSMTAIPPKPGVDVRRARTRGGLRYTLRGGALRFADCLPPPWISSMVSESMVLEEVLCTVHGQGRFDAIVIVQIAALTTHLHHDDDVVLAQDHGRPNTARPRRVARDRQEQGCTEDLRPS